MQNKVNPYSFRANVVSRIKSFEPKKLDKVKVLVERGTKDYPKKSLYITPTETDTIISFHTVGQALNKSRFFNGSEIFVDTKMLDIGSMDAPTMAKIFIEFFNFLIKAEKQDPDIAILQNEIKKAQGMIDVYKRKAENIDLPRISKIYQTLAGRKMQHLEKMEKTLSKILAKYNKDKEELIDKYPAITLE